MVIGGLVHPGIVSAQGIASFGPRDKVAIEQLFDDYGKAFAKEDYATLREYIQAPFVRLGPSNTFNETSSGDWVVLRTIDDALSFYRAAREALKAQGVDVRSEWRQTRVTALSAERALVNRTYRRYRKGGSPFDAASVYVVTKSSGSWKICGLMNQDLRQFGRVY
jgi:hypothetical protein